LVEVGFGLQLVEFVREFLLVLLIGQLLQDFHQFVFLAVDVVRQLVEDARVGVDFVLDSFDFLLLDEHFDFLLELHKLDLEFDVLDNILLDVFQGSGCIHTLQNGEFLLNVVHLYVADFTFLLDEFAEVGVHVVATHVVQRKFELREEVVDLDLVQFVVELVHRQTAFGLHHFGPLLQTFNQLRLVHRRLVVEQVLLDVVFSVNAVSKYPLEALIWLHLEVDADSETLGVLLLGQHTNVFEVLLL